MDFKISNCNNFFKVKGILNKNNVSLFNDEFNNIFDRVNNLTISIQDIISMDKYGVDNGFHAEEGWLRGAFRPLRAQ